MGSYYDRKERDLNFALKSTDEHVAPGAYDLDKPTRYKLRNDSYAPFNSLSSRNTLPLVAHNPAPGQYNPDKPHAPQCAAPIMRSTTERFPKEEEKTPGPAAYDIDKRLIKSNTENLHIKAHSAPTLSREVTVGKIRFIRKPNVPSIPHPRMAYGYEESDQGELIRQKPPRKDTSLGPAYYKHPISPQDFTEKYKGVHLGNKTEKRTDLYQFDSDIPGPGEYDLASSTMKKPAFVTGEKHELRINRFTEAVEERALKEGTPGPGKYALKSGFESAAATSNVTLDGVDVDRPPFLSSGRRFVVLKNQVPGPGAYSDPRTAMETIKKPSALKKTPFSQTATRFSSNIQARFQPGPGSYTIPGIGTQSIKKALLESTRKGAFGTTTGRDTMLTKEQVQIPGPGHYQPKQEISTSRYVQMHANFASGTKRDDSKVNEAPPPGAYEVDKSYRALADHKPKARRTTGPVAERFRPEKFVMAPEPGSYDPKILGASNNAGASFSSAQRFSKSINNMPGPADYTFSPLIQDTVLKGTFNATLNNPLVAPGR